MIDDRGGVRVGVCVGVYVGAGALALLACIGPSALAALPNPLVDGLRHCSGESDQAKRLACFDALAATLPKVEADQFGLTADIARKRQPPPTAAAPTMGSASDGTASNGTNSNGTAPTATAGTAGTAPAAGTAKGAKKAEPKPGEEVLPGKIAALRQSSNGSLVFTLDNNQVWVQSDADTRFSFKVGDDVRIEHGAMGSFWLAANKGRKTKVKRIS